LSGGQGELAGKIVRFGTMGEIDDNDIVRAIEALESALADEGVKVRRESAVSAARAVLSER
jgi:aspartate aminotransferase-like enzyme